MMSVKRILIIRLGALGDFIQSFYPFAAIRQYYPNAEITLLTSAPFVDLAKRSPWFDRVIVDDKPSWFNIAGLIRLVKKLRGYDYIFDLQTSRRSTRYFRFTGQRQGSAIAKTASHRHDNEERNRLHTFDRQKDQLSKVGITDYPELDLSWFLSEMIDFSIDRPYVVLVPGCSARRMEKRWPIQYYGEIANMCLEKGLVPIIAGGKEEKEISRQILQLCPKAMNLIGKTSLFQLGHLMKNAQFSLGNDTGPMHIAALVGGCSVVLFSSSSNPALTAPRGKHVKILYEADLRNLSVKKVAQELNWVH